MEGEAYKVFSKTAGPKDSRVAEALLPEHHKNAQTSRRGLERGWPLFSTKPEGSDSHVKEQESFIVGLYVCVMGISRCRKSGAPHLVEVVPHMFHDGLHPQPGLLCSGDDLVGWQKEAIVPSISQLKSKCILDAIIICPVSAAPASWIC